MTMDTEDPQLRDGSPARPVPIGYVAGGVEQGDVAGTIATRDDQPAGRSGTIVRGKHPGDRYMVRVVQHLAAERATPGAIVPARDPAPPRTPLGRAYRRLKRALIGTPLASSQAIHERLTKVKALAVLSSDALSSVAYGPEAALGVLTVAGAGALAVNLPIMVAIALLLAIVTISYRQTIFAYPSGGGSYIVASDNLGEAPGLMAAAALLIDYVLTVAVSISAGVLALTSAFPTLIPYEVPIGLGCIVLIMVGNLRGLRESASLFAAPTYLFIGAIFGLIAIGLVKVFVLRDPVATSVPRDSVEAGQSLGILLILKAFSSGCSAMTGVEAISNGVPAFQRPESKNASTTMIWMSSILATMLLGVTVLLHQYGLVPRADETALSQLTRLIVGSGPLYFLVQLATLLILVLAANTSYADFPRLASILARDRYLPRLFGFRGDRLAFTVGIAFLSAASALLIILFRGDTTALIPLYAVGVFVSFTMSQAGMVRHWWRERGRGWAVKATVNGIGAVATAVVAFLSGATKLISGEPLFRAFGYNVHAGSWIVLVLIPMLIGGMLAIHRHYEAVAREMAEGDAVVAETPLTPGAIRHTVVVPIAGLNRVAFQTLAYARSIAPNVTAVHVDDDPEAIDNLREQWSRLLTAMPFLCDVQLVVIESPYRALAQPLLAFIDELDARDPSDTLTVILPEFVLAHWWEHLLHNQTALRLKAALLFRPGTVVTSVPYHLRRDGRARPVERAPQS